MRCDGENCNRKIDPETDRHVLVSEELVAPDLGLEDTAGRVLCADCGDVDEARLAPSA